MSRPDVLIAGAGPAGALAALVLARAGAKVCLVDRAAFPRDKLCGDTVNPGAAAILRRHALAAVLECRGLPVDGMVVTGPGGVRVKAQYGTTGQDITGWALRRRELDAALVGAAVEAGAQLEERVVVRGPIVDTRDGQPQVRGLIVRSATGRAITLPATVTIAADGRRSAVATSLGLSRATRHPRRWVVGGYFSDVDEMSSHGEMHVRGDHYIGVAPVPGGLTNVCVVSAVRSRFAQPEVLLRGAVMADAELASRFERARLAEGPVSLGPMGVDSYAAGCPGLLLAGDAAGFIDPITGDGIRFALRGGELAAQSAQRMLETGRRDGSPQLARWRAVEFRAKWRFNRGVRALVGSRVGVRAGTWGAAAAPWVLRRAIGYAGDTRVADLSMADRRP